MENRGVETDPAKWRQWKPNCPPIVEVKEKHPTFSCPRTTCRSWERIDSDSAGLGWGLKGCISSKLPGDVEEGCWSGVHTLWGFRVENARNFREVQASAASAGWGAEVLVWSLCKEQAGLLIWSFESRDYSLLSPTSAGVASSWRDWVTELSDLWDTELSDLNRGLSENLQTKEDLYLHFTAQLSE